MRLLGKEGNPAVSQTDDRSPAHGLALSVPRRHAFDDVIQGHEESKVSGRTRVLVADDHAMYRIAVQQLVNTAPDMEIAGVARDGAEAWNMTLELKPDVVVLDSDMPIVSGIEVLARLRTEMPQVRIVLNSSDPAASAIARGFGVECVAKEALPELLLAAIRGSVATVER